MDNDTTSVQAENTGLTENPQGQVEVAEPTTEQTGQFGNNNADSLPEQVADRTREQFEKLKQHNAELARKLAETEKKLKYGDSVLDNFGTSYQPAIDTPHLTNQQVNTLTQRFIDDEGNVNVEGLERTLREANERARKAETDVAKFISEQKKAEEARQLREAYKVAPWLDPQSSSFDEKKFNLTRDRIARYWFEGKNPELTFVASEIESELGNYATPEKVEQEKQKAVAEQRESINKQNAVSNVSSNRGGRAETTDIDELRKRSLNNDMSAITERLKRAGL